MSERGMVRIRRVGIGESGKEPMSLFLEMASARYMPYWCLDQADGGCSERPGCPLTHLREIDSER